MGLFSAGFFDASGKDKDNPFVTVAGAVSPVKKWIRFEREWGEVLKSEGVSEFHATDFAASQGEYRSWRGDTARRSAFVEKLKKVIEKNANKLFLVTVEIGAWREVNGEYLLEEWFYSPYALAGFSVCTHALKWAIGKKVRPPLMIFFEDGDARWAGLKELCIRHNAIEPERLSKKRTNAFQIGDWLAWKTRITATNATAAIDTLDHDAALRAIASQIKSLQRHLVCPFRNGIYASDDLEQTCQNAKVPRRPRPVTAARLSHT
jgi:hypothetical protein